MSATCLPLYRTPLRFSRDHIGPGSRLPGGAGTVNGGWVAGTLASHLGPGPVEVTLHAPTPPDTRLVLDVGDGEAVLAKAGYPWMGDVLATARAVDRPTVPPAPAPVKPTDIDPTGFVGWTVHPFPDCIVCGTARAPGTGLRLFPAPTSAVGRPTTVAAVWEPDRSAPRRSGDPSAPRRSGDLSAPRRSGDAAWADEAGTVDPVAVWGALDCPTGWAHAGLSSAPAVLGRLTAELLAPVTAGRRYVVVAQATGVDGRKHQACAGIYDDRAELVAWSQATWITVR